MNGLSGWFTLPNFRGMILLDNGRPVVRMRPKENIGYNPYGGKIYRDGVLLKDDDFPLEVNDENFRLEVEMESMDTPGSVTFAYPSWLDDDQEYIEFDSPGGADYFSGEIRNLKFTTNIDGPYSVEWWELPENKEEWKHVHINVDTDGNKTTYINGKEQ